MVVTPNFLLRRFGNIPNNHHNIGMTTILEAFFTMFSKGEDFKSIRVQLLDCHSKLMSISLHTTEVMSGKLGKKYLCQGRPEMSGKCYKSS